MMGWPGLKKESCNFCCCWCLRRRLFCFVFFVVYVCACCVAFALSPFSYFEKKKVDGF